MAQLMKSAKRFSKLLSAGLVAVLAVWFFFYSNRFVRYQGPDFLTFGELKRLSQSPSPGIFLKGKLERFWRTPIVSNEAYYAGEKPHRPSDPQLGPYLRLVSWNIEKSIRIKDAITAFTSADRFRSLISPKKAAEGSSRYQTVLGQRDRLSDADIVVLQEMDIGVKRSGYINAAGEVAKALKMNYAYAPEQLEIDPVYLGGEKIRFDDGSVDEEQSDYYAVDPAKYRGVFGIAVLSRYPIKRAVAFQLKTRAYHWFEGEKPKIGFVEKTRRAGSKLLFQNQLTREIKAGNRTFFRVDLAVPGVPEGTLTIIDIHLEIKCQPKGREEQMAEILSYIKGIRHPVIMVGDFNSAPDDLSPTSAWRVAERTVESPETWVSVGTAVFLPYSLAINATRVVGKYTKNFNDPFAPNISVVAPNPVKPLFEMIQNYRFSDGKAFDFRGNAERSVNGKEGILANSNQRSRKAFKTSWSVKRPLSIIGKYRLDWVFVKSDYLKDPYDVSAPYKFAPHRGETLEEMNTSLEAPISDHDPNVVDIPFQEPKIQEKEKPQSETVPNPEKKQSIPSEKAGVR